MKAIISSVAVLAVLMAGAALSGVPGVARAATVPIEAEATGEGDASATGEFTLDDESLELEYEIAVSDVPDEDEVVGAALTGDDISDIALDGPDADTFSGSVTLSQEEVDALLAGDVFLVVFSTETADDPEGLAMGPLVAQEAAEDEDDDELVEDDEDQDDEDDPTSTPVVTPTIPAALLIPTPQVTATPDETEEVGGVTQVSPPSTGDAGLAGGGGSGLALPAAILAALTGIGLGGAVLYRSRA